MVCGIETDHVAILTIALAAFGIFTIPMLGIMYLLEDKPDKKAIVKGTT